MSYQTNAIDQSTIHRRCRFRLEAERHDLVTLLSTLTQHTKSKPAHSVRLQAKLKRIEAALRRLQHGSFGQCPACQGNIEPQRLLRLPFAEYCFHCQRQKERHES